MTDYIERQAAKEAIVKAIGKGYSPFNAIVMLPAADVWGVKRGKWKAKDFHTVACSECGFDMDIMTVDDHVLNHANFCPNCGAYMRDSEI